MNEIIQRMQQMLESGQDNAMLRFSLGKAHFDAREFDIACAHLQKAVEHDAGYSAAWKWLGCALRETGNIRRAREVFEQGIAVARKKGDKQAEKEMQVFLRRIEKQNQQG